MRRVIGIHACLEALKVRPNNVKRVLLKKGWEASPSLQDVGKLAQRKNIKIKIASEDELNTWGSQSQGVGAEVSESPVLNWDDLKGDGHRVLVALDNLEDPQNFGAILRTGWLMGVDGVVVPKDRAATLTPTVHKVASGGVEHVPIERVTNLSEALVELKEMGFWVYGLGFENSKSLWDEEFPEKTVLVVGAEGKGLRPKTIKNCDQIINIHQIDASASYNAAMSAGIAIAEVRRQKLKS